MAYPRLEDVVAVLDRLYPPATAHYWDSAGLITGEPGAEIRRIHFAVDPTLEVIREAVKAKADLLVTHHPLLLRGVHSVATNTAKGMAIHRLIRSGTALFNAHTNADDAHPGVNDALARTLGLADLVPLVPSTARTDLHLVTTVPADALEAVLDAAAAAGAGQIGEYRRCAFTVAGDGTYEPGPAAKPAVGTPGQRETTGEIRVELQLPAAAKRAVVAAIKQAHPYEEPVIWITELVQPQPGSGTGRIGTLAQPMTLEMFALHVAEALPFTPQGIKVAGDPQAMVARVAVCGGSGDSLLDAVVRSRADVYLTADLRHHPSLEAREQAGEGPPYLVDVAHWASEWPWLHGCASRLQTQLLQGGYEAEVLVSETRTDPWTFRLASSGGVVR